MTEKTNHKTEAGGIAIGLRFSKWYILRNGIPEHWRKRAANSAAKEKELCAGSRRSG